MNNSTKIIKCFIKQNCIDVSKLDISEFKKSVLLNHDAHLLMMALVAAALECVEWDEIKNETQVNDKLQ